MRRAAPLVLTSTRTSPADRRSLMPRRRDNRANASKHDANSHYGPSSLSRRELVQWGAAVGIGGAALGPTLHASAAPSRHLLRQGDPTTLTIALDGSPADL